jgi:ABC-2 type transport system ATP-binding protein
MRQGFSLQTRGLTKRFGSFTAVQDLNLSLHPGESYGFLGPNGAGKTTTLMMILGIWKPTRGEVHIDGRPVCRDAFDLKSRIGVVAEYQSFYEEMSAWEYLMFFGRLFQAREPAKRAEALLERVGLLEWKDVLIGGYSTGMKKKLGFVRALLHKPELLILDEPVSGLDPFGIVQVRELLQAEQAAGCTLLVSSHILSEVEHTVDRVGIIARGRLLVEDTMDNLRAEVSAARAIRLRFAELSEQALAALASQPFVRELEADGPAVTLWVDAGTDRRAEIGAFILAHNLIVLEMKQEEISLEEAFITITENNLHELTKPLGEAA